jgi:hypothetical protein
LDPIDPNYVAVWTQIANLKKISQMKTIMDPNCEFEKITQMKTIVTMSVATAVRLIHVFSDANSCCWFSSDVDRCILKQEKPF